MSTSTIYSVTCENFGGFKFLAKSRHHKVIFDQPVEKDGEDTGMKPPELFIASLGACMGQVIAKFCKQNNITTKGMLLTVTWKKEHNSGEINIKLSMPKAISEKYEKALIRVANECPLHKALHSPPKITLKIN